MTSRALPQNTTGHFQEAAVQPSELRRPTVAQIIGWALLLCGITILSLRSFDTFQLGAYGDDAAYILLAQGLVDNLDYGVNLQENELVGNFPPGYPLLLTPIARLFPGNLEAFRWVALLATLINATILFWGWRALVPRSSFWWGLAVAALYALSPLAIEHSRMVMSEAIFLTFCLLAFLPVLHLTRNQTRPWLALPLGMLLVYAFLIRSVGLILALYIIAYLFVRLKRRAVEPMLLMGLGAATLIAAILLLTPVTLQDFLPQQYGKSDSLARGALVTPDEGAPPTSARGESEPTFDSKIATLLYDYVYGGIVQHMGQDLRNTVLPMGGGQREQKLAQALGWPQLSLHLGFIFTAFMAGGIFWLMKSRRFSPFVGFAVVYFFVLFAWVWSGDRLLYPILPQLEFILLASIAGVFAIAGGVLRPLNRPAVRNSALVMVVMLLLLANVFSGFRQGESRPHVGDIATRTDWLASATNPSDVIASEEPVLDQLYVNRPTTHYTTSCASPTEVLKWLTQYQVSYVLVAGQLEWQEEYVPHYSDAGRCMLDALQTLAGQGHAKLVHAEDQQLVKVFQFRGVGN